VFQHYAAFKHLTVRDNVAFGLKIRKQPKADIKEKVDNLLEVVGLAGFQTRYPNQLSGGQRQRMALARALAVNPEVLLLDEPFGALDAKVREDLRAWLRRLHDEVHVTTVLVTHDQAEALDVADRIAVLNKGRIEQVGTPTEVYDSPANAFVMSFLGTVSSLNGILVRPHDIRVGRNPEMAIAADDGTAESTGVTRATIDRIAYLGFEVRVELTSATTGGPFTAQITRGDAEALGSRRVTRCMCGPPGCRRSPARCRWPRRGRAVQRLSRVSTAAADVRCSRSGRSVRQRQGRGHRSGWSARAGCTSGQPSAAISLTKRSSRVSASRACAPGSGHSNTCARPISATRSVMRPGAMNHGAKMIRRAPR
jgi:ABC-type sulfate/molybdate transport systems ATPase subunit